MTRDSLCRAGEVLAKYSWIPFWLFVIAVAIWGKGGGEPDYVDAASEEGAALSGLIVAGLILLVGLIGLIKNRKDDWAGYRVPFVTGAATIGLIWCAESGLGWFWQGLGGIVCFLVAAVISGIISPEPGSARSRVGSAEADVELRRNPTDCALDALAAASNPLTNRELQKPLSLNFRETQGVLDELVRRGLVAKDTSGLHPAYTLARSVMQMRETGKDTA